MSFDRARIIVTDENAMLHWPNGSLEFIGGIDQPIRTWFKIIGLIWRFKRDSVPYVLEVE